MSKYKPMPVNFQINIFKIVSELDNYLNFYNLSTQ